MLFIAGYGINHLSGRWEETLFPLYRPATNMLIGLWRRDGSVLDYAVPRAKKFVSGKRPQWNRAAVAYLLAIYDKNPEEAYIAGEDETRYLMRMKK